MLEATSTPNLLALRTTRQELGGGPKVWNKLPNEIKPLETVNIFKRLIKQWSGIQCSCKFADMKIPDTYA